KADLQQFTELISIFLENATKYALNDHPLEVTLSKKGSIRMTFRNSIDYEYEGDPSLLFDRFYRTDDSRNSSNGGSGLGLSIAQAIVRSNKGKIKAEIKSKDYIYFEITF
ncbi:MAG: ATP-binding protein, partial [Bacilli bacterium]